MRFLFQIIAGPNAGNKFLLRANTEMVVGRTELADYPVPDDFNMSSRHFCLKATDTSCFVQDLESTNGTMVNGQPVSRIDLSDGDRISAGSSVLQLRCEKPSPRPRILKPRADAEVALDSSEDVARPGRSKKKTRALDTDIEPPAVVERAAEVPIAEVHVPEPPVTEPCANELAATEIRLAEVPRDELELSAVLPAESAPAPAAPALALADSMQSKWPFATALQDGELRVRQAALFAAAMTGQQWLLGHCQAAAQDPSIDRLDVLLMLAIIGGPADLPLIEHLLANHGLHKARFEIVAAFGHPQLVPRILECVRGGDPSEAAAARSAFTAITGCTPDGHGQAWLDSADRFWTREETRFLTGDRWTRGVDISKVILDDATLSQLDMKSRGDATVRAAFHGHRQEPRSVVGWSDQARFTLD